MTPASPAAEALGAALGALPLKEMDPSLLSFAILREGADLGAERDTLVRALELAALVHRDDVRGARRNLTEDPYVTHPFRLVLRLIRYGCHDVAVLCAAALHDTVEDHPDEVVALLDRGDDRGEPGGERRGRALALLAATFGDDVASIVAALTNPPRAAGDTEEDRLRAYRDHVGEAIGDPGVFLVKFADFVDNAGSLRHMADGERRARLTRKYAPLVPLLRSAFDTHAGALQIGPEGQAEMRRHLDAIGARLAP